MNAVTHPPIHLLGRLRWCPACQIMAFVSNRAHPQASQASYEAANRAGLVVTGSPKTVIQKFKHIIDRTDPGYITFWARESKKPHEATMRGIELLGKDVIPELRKHQSALMTGKEVTPWPQ